MNINGFVLRAPRTAPTNVTTAEITSGVVRTALPFPDEYTLPTPEVFDLHAAQYQAAVLDAPGTTTVEYLLWAANTSNLAVFNPDETPTKFFWTRNDRYQKRFGWTGKRWEPFKGGPAQLIDETTELTPRMQGLKVGFSFPEQTGYSPLRWGNTHTPLRVLVVSSVEDSFDDYDAAIDTEGRVCLSPSFNRPGEKIWYSPRDFDSESTGLVGNLSNTLHIAPIPLPWEQPLIRIGQRSYLTPVQVASNAVLQETHISPNEVGISRSTGKLKFNTGLLLKGDIKHPNFDKHWLGAQVFYDGIALGCQSVVEPVLLGEDLVVPIASSPNKAGVLITPDGSGAIPDGTGGVRVGSGAIRKVLDPIGDTFLVSQDKTITLHEVDRIKDLPKRVPTGEAYVAREHPSPIKVSRHDQGPFYFCQARLTPSVLIQSAQVMSRNRFVFRFPSEETFTFQVDDTTYSWSSTSLEPKAFYSTREVVDSIRQVYQGVHERGGHVVIYGNDYVEIGWVGAPQLGFLPGWRAVDGQDNWLTDSGVSFGLFRSQEGSPDYVATDTYSDEILQDIQPSPYVFLPEVPLEDVPGYDTDTYFQRAETIETPDGPILRISQLTHYDTVQYNFANDRFKWLQEGETALSLSRPSSSVSLGHAPVVPETFNEELGGGLLVAENGGEYVYQELGADYLLPRDGELGSGLLVETHGREVLSGSFGVLRAGVFSASNVNFADASADPLVENGSTVIVDGQPVFLPLVREGYILQFSDGESFRVSELLGQSSLKIESSDTKSGSWRILTGFLSDVYDPALVADQSYLPFSHLPSDPFNVGVLTKLIPQDGLYPIPISDDFSLRFGIEGEDVTPTYLEVVELGVLPQTLYSPRSGRLYIGEDVFSPVPVESFSDEPESIEILTSTGELAFSRSLVSRYSGSRVVYRQDFSGEAVEYDPIERLVSTPSPVESLYLVEHGREYTLNALSGSFGFVVPCLSKQLVEVSYYRSNAEGRREGEQQKTFLTVPVEEEARRVNHTTFLFNESLSPTPDLFRPSVRIGGVLQNYGGQKDYALESVGDAYKITFLNKTIPPHVSVHVRYPTLEMQGGESVFTLPHAPIYKPPFFLKAGEGHFGLRGERTDLKPGQLLRLGADCFYIQSVEYFPPRLNPIEEPNPLNPAKPVLKGGDVTKVGIFPAPSYEVGSRASGRDLISLLSANPIRDESGFLQEIPVRFDPVSRGQATIRFHGDVVRFAVPGHLIEIGGYPFTIASAKLEGDVTSITTTAPFPRGFAEETVRLSYRPVYPPNTLSLLGLGPVVETQPYELLRWQGGKGHRLKADIDYTLDFSSGQIELFSPLLPKEELTFSHSRIRVLTPTVQNEIVREPRVYAKFRYVGAPTGRGVIRASYTYRRPDTFYLRIPTVQQLMGEIFEEGVSPRENWERGITGPRWEVGHLYDKDKIARAFIHYNNEAIVAFEQVLEAIDGQFIGDRDGKFRFALRSKAGWPTPGFEDPITNRLIPANLWQRVMGYPVLPKDELVSPPTLQLVGDVITGKFPAADELRDLIETQLRYVTNDIDDLVMTGPSRPRFVRQAQPPFYRMSAMGEFARMGEAHILSRLFPMRAKALFTTFPGVYTWGRVIDGVRRRTTGSEIGVVSNPVLGRIENITAHSLSRRMARARVWSYHPNGFNDIEEPCVMLSMVPLSEVPVTNSSIDTSRLISQGGDIPDIESGDLSLSIPGFTVGDSILWGVPDGSLYEGRSGEGKLYIYDIIDGCVMRFGNQHGELISDPNLVLVEDTVAGEFLERGHTLLSTLGSTDLSDPPTLEELSALSETYRNGFDVRVRSNGSVVDMTLPSAEDGSFPLQEMWGQNPPPPLTPLEGDVSFLYNSALPLEVPALRGETVDDDGDYAIPYLRAANAELTLLGDPTLLPSLRETFIEFDGTYIYPDEHLGVGVPVADLDPGVGEGLLNPYDLLLIECGQEGAPQGILQIGAIAETGEIEPPRFVTATTIPDQPGEETGSPIKYVCNNVIVHVNGYEGTTPRDEVLSGVKVYERDSTGDGNYDLTVLDFSSVGGLTLNGGVVPGQGGLNELYREGNTITIRLYSRPDEEAGPLPPAGSALLKIDIAFDTITVEDAISGLPPSVLNVEGVVFGGFDPDDSDNTHIVIPSPILSNHAWSIPHEDVGDIRQTYYEYDFSIDLDVESHTAYIDSDRLTLRDVVDFRHIALSGFAHPLSAEVLETSLEVEWIMVGGNPSTVDSIGRQTFSRQGTFGGLKVDSWDELPESLRYSAIPSSPVGPEGVICRGEGFMGSVLNEDLSDRLLADCRVSQITVSEGVVSNVQAGDVLVVRQSSDETDKATTKAGTYLVRHAVEANAELHTRRLLLQCHLGRGHGWVDEIFPTVVSFGGGEIVLSSPATFDGRVIIVQDLSLLTAADPDDFATALSSAAITGVDGTTLQVNDWRDALGNPTEPEDVVGKQVGGLTGLSVRIRGDGLPPHNAVGFHSDECSHGFNLIYAGSHLLEGWTVMDKVPVDSSVFHEDPTVPVYHHIPDILYVSGVPDETWAAINDPNGHTEGQWVHGLLPGTTLTLGDPDTGDPGFWAQAGIFLEPSFPQPVVSVEEQVHVVERGSDPYPTTGVRSYADFNLGDPVAELEGVEFEVRRIRRFHEVFTNMASLIAPLRYVYEVRRGFITSYESGIVEAIDFDMEFGGFAQDVWKSGESGLIGTNLGAFDDPDVNVHPGDVFRLLANDGRVLEEVEIAAVLSSGSLRLSEPGLTAINVVGARFEIYLRQAPVPQEQSLEQLLALVGSEVTATRADFAAETGGFVDVTNQLQDDLTEESWTERGVRVGDIVLVDPQPLIAQTGERGARPVGDVGVVGRVGYEVGQPSPLDDNRGFYRVVQVGEVLEVVGVSDLLDVSEGYAILPTVEGGGQMDLRVTAKRVGGTYGSDLNSIRPFSFRVIRPNALFEDETIDLILMMRERLLSWMQEVRGLRKGGSYWDFQSERHCHDLGTPNDPVDGLGVVRNETVESVVGKTGVSPFLNTSDCLSLLDRRFWVGDTRLAALVPDEEWGWRAAVEGDPEYPAPGGPYALSERRVYPEFISEPLDTRERLRRARWEWIVQRVHRTEGTLALIRNYRSENND